MKHTLTLSAVALATLLSACASPRTTPPALAEARSVVHGAERDPQVLDHAALQLKRATDALQRAESLNRDDRSLADIESAAYVAQREAQTAMTIARAKRNEDAIKAAEAERERARADARAAEAAQARAQAQSARVEAVQARSEASQAQVQASVAQQQADNARLQASDAEARAQAASQAAVQAQVTVATLQQQLTELKAQHTDRGTLVTLGDVLFETGRADIKPGAQLELRKLAAYLQEHPERMVLIEGFTDSVGSESTNLTLSRARAESVAMALAALGVSGNRIATQGYGESYPVADNATATNRALNRRVEVYISDGSQPVRARG